MPYVGTWATGHVIQTDSPTDGRRALAIRAAEAEKTSSLRTSFIGSPKNHTDNTNMAEELPAAIL